MVNKRFACLVASYGHFHPGLPTSGFKYACEILTGSGIPMKNMFVSLERRMHCGMGKCCRCNVGSTFTCIDGPVFDYWSVMNLKEAI